MRIVNTALVTMQEGVGSLRDHAHVRASSERASEPLPGGPLFACFPPWSGIGSYPPPTFPYPSDSVAAVPPRPP